MSIRIEARLLGGVAITVDDKLITSWPTRVSQALFVYLLRQPRPVAREQLMDWFFQGSDPQQARANLRATLSRIKRHVGPVLDANRTEVWVDGDVTVWADVDAVDHRLATDSAESLRRTLANYHGDFLAGFHLRDAPEFEQWVVTEQERLRLLALDGFQRLLRDEIAQGAYRQALLSAEKLLTIEPLLENVHRTKMLLLARTGQRALALRHFDVAQQLFADELSAPLTDATVALYERLQQIETPPPLRLPADRRAFVGRAAEITTLRHAIAQPERRLITLLGMGGVGKTRLSQETVRRIHADAPGAFLDGIYFIDLVHVRTVEGIVTQIAQVLNLFLAGSQPAAQQLHTQLQHKELLLILDNFEQLVDVAADFVAALLQACSAVTLLITSRQRLDLYEETVLDVGGLPLADEESVAAPSEAMQLFISSAAQHQLNYAPTTVERREMAHICRLLDGVPLGIELSAGRMRQHAVVEIAREIERNLDFLNTSLRNVPQRQRSLRAVFDYSWRLLSPAEQATLARLSLLRGDFDAAAAVAVADTTTAQLQALVSHSLLQQEAPDRFSLHPMVVQFSAEKLTNPDHTMQRLAAHYVTLLTGFDLIDHWPTFKARQAAVRFAFENVLVAWHWLLEQAAASAADDDALALLDALRRPMRSYYLATSQIYAGHLLFRAAHETLRDAGWEMSDSAEKQLLLAKIAIHDADLGRIIGDYPRAIAIAEPHLPRLEQAQALSDLYSAYLLLHDAYRAVGRSADAAEMTPKLERTAFQTERDELIGSIQLERAHIAREAGDGDAALDSYRNALAYLEPLEHPRYLAIAYDYMGAIYFRRGAFEQAMVHQQRALDYAKAGELLYTEALVTVNLSLSLGSVGRHEAALDLLANGRQMLVQMNQLQQLVVADRTRGDIMVLQGRWAEAASAYQQALRLARTMGTQRTESRVVARLPLLFANTGAAAEARAILAHLATDETINELDRDWLRQAEAIVADDSAETEPSAQAVADILDAFLNKAW